MTAVQVVCGILLLFCINSIYTTVPSHDSMDIPLQTQIQYQAVVISELRVKLEEQNSKIAQQSMKIAEQDTKIAEQNTKILEQEVKFYKQKDVETNSNQTKPLVVNNVATMFTRWGRQDCPAISEQVYSGTTGGSWYDDIGGAADYVCLPPDPIWGPHQDFKANVMKGGLMYGAEYEDMPNSQLNQYTIPCSVCRATNFSTMLMVPGRDRCYPGWQEAYHGELTSGPLDYKSATQYICMDRNPQKTGTYDNDNGKIIHMVWTRCGSLPCPPYRNDTALSCVVCMK